MAYLVKCSLCGRDVSNECNSCPGCGHNVKSELYMKEREKKDKWKEQGLCEECGNNEFIEVDEIKSIGYGVTEFWTYYKRAKCASCGWIDTNNSNYHFDKDMEKNYNRTNGHGTWWGLRKKKISW